MRNFFLPLFFLMLLAVAPVFAQDGSAAFHPPMEDFRKIPILHEGRYKPLDSFAAHALEKTAGRENRSHADFWLAQTLFNPHYAATQPVFLIKDAALIAQASLPPRENNLYSLEEIAPFLSKTQDQALELAAQDEKTLSKEQHALAALHENALFYGQIMNALTAFLPMDIPLPESLDIVPETYEALPTWQEIKEKESVLMNRVRAILDRKGENPALYTEEEKQIMALAFEFQILQEAGARNAVMRLFPSDGAVWLSPWAAVVQGEEKTALLKAWAAMARAFREGNADAFRAASRTAYEAALLQNGDKRLAARLNAEIVYNTLKPFGIAAVLYGFAALSGAAFLWRPRKFFYGLALFTGGTGALANLCGIVLRVFILQRPPVGSLYESLLFVALVILAAGFALERNRKDALSLTGSALSAFLVLFIAPVIAPDGDDLQMLVAVLNTNFWLATHVVCITAGYGLCIMTAGLAHIYLFRKGSVIAPEQDGLLRSLYITSLWALFLTATGTILGGIWADQSWGRFWGWDPKENGALLIVLWLIWAHHGRLSAHLKPLLFAVSLAYLNVIVALAWFGVNLLGVGLHSYGFISGIAAGLAAFCFVETAALTALFYRADRRGKIKEEKTI